MRTILYLLEKEFTQIFRNRTMLFMIFFAPVVQLVILVNAANLEMKDIEVSMVDMDQSSLSRQLIAKLTAPDFFIYVDQDFSMERVEGNLKTGHADMILHIPGGFEKDLHREGNVKVQVLINAINGTAAGLIQGYVQNILMDFNREIIPEFITPDQLRQQSSIQVVPSFWFNPELNYRIYMLPGILVILVTIVGMFLTALNLVREKEMGTAEQINVTPIKKYQFITGKLLPFWIIAMVELSIGLLVGRYFFDLPIVGSLLVLYLYTAIYLLVMLGAGLLVAAVSQTQQQVMFLNYFFLLTFILMSGIFTPVESMPEWAHKVNIINPFAYFMRVIRMVLLKGSGIGDILNEIYALSVYAVMVISLASWRYRKAV